MTDEPNDGGPAFPAMLPGGNYCTPGMSLRDYFAGQALVGLLSNERNDGVLLHNANDAYAFADAMLTAREPKDTTTAQQIALGIGGGK